MQGRALHVLYSSVSKVMVLSHSLTPLEERMPYHSVRLPPARPLIFMGRSAHLEPKIDVRKAMFCFYRDLDVKLILIFT